MASALPMSCCQRQMRPHAYRSLHPAAPHPPSSQHQADAHMQPALLPTGWVHVLPPLPPPRPPRPPRPPTVAGAAAITIPIVAPWVVNSHKTFAGSRSKCINLFSHRLRYQAQSLVGCDRNKLQHAAMYEASPDLQTLVGCSRPA